MSQVQRELLDPIRARALGNKRPKDSSTIEEKQHKYEEKGGRYYPTTISASQLIKFNQNPYQLSTIQQTTGGNSPIQSKIVPQKLDEWAAYSQQIKDYDKKLQDQNRARDQDNKQNHKNVLENQRDFKQNQKSYLYQQEVNDYSLKNKLSNELNTNLREIIKQEDKTLKQYLTQNHSNQEQQKRLIKDQNKQFELESDLKTVQKANQSLEAERQFFEQMKQRKSLENLLDLQRADQKKKEQNYQKQLDQQEWQKLFEQNSQKELDRINERQKYYKDVENKIQSKSINYLKTAAAKETEVNQKKLQIAEYPDADQFNHRLFFKAEENLIQQRAQQLQSKAQSNLQDVQVHENMKKFNMQEREYQNQTRKKQDEIIKSKEQYESEKLVLQKQDYKQFLENQIKYKQDMEYNYGTMTGHEKKMNKQDLRDYKNNEHQIGAMIPGIHNLQTVGTSPLKRGLVKSFDYVNQKSLQLPIKLGNNKIDEIAQKKEDPLSLLNSSPVTRKNHNPITNPLSYVNQNPYVQKEIEQAQQKLQDPYGSTNNLEQKLPPISRFQSRSQNKINFAGESQSTKSEVNLNKSLNIDFKDYKYYIPSQDHRTGKSIKTMMGYGKDDGSPNSQFVSNTYKSNIFQ